MKKKLLSLSLLIILLAISQPSQCGNGKTAEGFPCKNKGDCLPQLFCCNKDGSSPYKWCAMPQSPQCMP